MPSSSVVAKLPAPPPEPSVCRATDRLAPLFAGKLNRVLARMSALGFPCLVYETGRTDERQAWLFGFGRLYDDGRGIVTNSRTVDDTWHGYWLAVDVVHAKKMWDAPEIFWQTLRSTAEEEGLTSGADWDRDMSTSQQQADKPHVQWWIPGMHRSPSAHAALLRRSPEGVLAVWKELRAV